MTKCTNIFSSAEFRLLPVQELPLLYDTPDKELVFVDGYHNYAKLSTQPHARPAAGQEDKPKNGHSGREIAGEAQVGYKVDDALIVSKNTHQSSFDNIACVHALVALLNACAEGRDLCEGRKLHYENDGLSQNNVFFGNALISMYSQCGVIERAQEVFDKLAERSVVSWNGLISGYTQHGLGEEALHLFERMQLEGFSPNAMTLSSVLKACGITGDVETGQRLHALIVGNGLLDDDVVLGGALVDMYAKCMLLVEARIVLDTLPVHNIVMWNALVTSYAQHGYSKKALCCLEHLLEEGISPTNVTYLGILGACGSMGDLSKGQEVHSAILKEGLCEDIMIANALIDMYSKYGSLSKAREIFDEIEFRDRVSWNSMIGGYAQHEQGEEALDCLEQMELEGVSLNAVTFLGILKACGSLGAAQKGQEIQAKVTKAGLLEKDMVVGTAVVDMWTKCGLLIKAEELFAELRIYDVVAWNTIMAGYAQFGNAEQVFRLYNKMAGEGLEPDLATATVLLTTCSHNGLLDKGEACLENMSTRSGFIPTVENQACMVDLFARAGLLDQAMAVICEFLCLASLSMLRSVLGACKKWGQRSLAMLAFEEAGRLHQNDGEAFVSLSNIYATTYGDEDNG